MKNALKKRIFGILKKLFWNSFIRNSLIGSLKDENYSDVKEYFFMDLAF